MAKIILMVGVPGSGKSTWILTHQPHFDNSHVIVSRDEIRFSYLQDGDEYFAYEKEVWKDFIVQIKKGLATKNEVYVDATHINEKNRAKLFRALGPALQNVELEAVYFDLPLEQIIQQNSNRTGRKFVPPEAIQNMYLQLRKPTFEEGFSKIYIINENGMTIKEELKEVL